MQHPAMKPRHGARPRLRPHLLPVPAASYSCLGSSPPEPSTMATETVVLKVTMSCEGCSGAVRRVLSKMQGVESFDIDMKEQKVTVKGNVKPEDVFQTVSKTGKKTSFWESEAAAPAAPAPAPAPEAAPGATTQAAAPAPEAAPGATTEAVPAAPAAEAAPSAAAEAPATTAEPEITTVKADA